MNYYKNKSVLFAMIPYLKDRALCYGEPKHKKKGQKLSSMHRCHNIQSLTYLNNKYGLNMGVEYNMFTTIAKYRYGVPYDNKEKNTELLNSFYDNIPKHIIDYPFFIDIDVDDHKDMDYCILSVKSIIQLYNKLNIPYELRFSGRGFHILSKNSNNMIFDPKHPKSIYKIYSSIALKLKNEFSDLIDVRVYDSQRRVKLPFSIAFYGDSKYVCTPIHPKELDDFRLNHYEVDKMRLRLSLRYPQNINGNLFKLMEYYGVDKK